MIFSVVGGETQGNREKESLSKDDSHLFHNLTPSGYNPALAGAHFPLGSNRHSVLQVGNRQAYDSSAEALGQFQCNNCPHFGATLLLAPRPSKIENSLFN
jgi:hypothetical protein